MIKTFEIEGKFRAKGRPRFTKKGFVYKVKEDIQNENLIIKRYVEEFGDEWFGKKPVEMLLTFVYQIPKATSKKNRELMLQGIIRPVKKPDADNLAKQVCDSLNKVAYEDDNQIIFLAIEKIYGEGYKTIVTIRGFDVDKLIEK